MSGPEHISDLAARVLARYGYGRRAIMAAKLKAAPADTKTVDVEIPVLSEDATAAFDERERQAARKRDADGKARKAAAARETQERIILGELGARVNGTLPDGRKGTLAQLADGRRVMVAREERKQAAQPAREYGWWVMMRTH